MSLVHRVLWDCADPDVLSGGSEDGLVGLVGGHEAGDDGPELGGVVGFVEVGEFVNEDVVDKAWRELEGGPVDVDALGAFGRTG